jgi:CheY-like chemotaxis protein
MTSQTPRILIADDDFEDRFMMTETFNELERGDAIHLVEDGLEVIQYLGANGAEKIKLIVLDLNMPRLNGTETLRMLKDNRKTTEIPVIIFSTSVNEIEKSICMKLGATEYITKPAKHSEYIQTCKKFYSISEEMIG